MSTTETLIQRRVSKGNNPEQSATMLESILSSTLGDEAKVRDLVQWGFATEKQARAALLELAGSAAQPFTDDQLAKLNEFKASDLRRRNQNPYERLYRIARKAAVDTAGGERAFRVIGSTLAAALVRSEVLAVIYNQDENTTNPQRMIEFARYAVERVTDELDAETI